MKEVKSFSVIISVFLFINFATCNRELSTFEPAQGYVQPNARLSLNMDWRNDDQTILRDSWALPFPGKEVIKANSVSFHKRSVVQSGGGHQVQSLSSNHSAGNHPLSDSSSSSAGGMHDKWQNGQDGAPKNLQALHERQRKLYEPPVVPTEPFPIHPIAKAPSHSPSPAPAPQAGLYEDSKRRLPNKPLPKQKSASSSSNAGKGATIAGLAAGATAMVLHQGNVEQRIEKKNKRGGNRGRKIEKSRVSKESNNFSKRSLQTYSALSPTITSGATYIPSINPHTRGTTSTGLFGYWPNGEKGAPITFSNHEETRQKELHTPSSSHSGSGVEPRHVVMGVLMCASGVQCYKVAKLARQTGSRNRTREQSRQISGPRRGRRINTVTGVNQLMKRENVLKRGQLN